MTPNKSNKNNGNDQQVLKADNQSGSETSAGENSTEHKDLKSVFMEMLKEIYNVEKQLLTALPQMAKAADNDELQDAFYEHYEQTQRHVERLEKVFIRLRTDAQEKESLIMKQLVEETGKIVSQYEMGPVRDALLIVGAQKVEHYEIAAYGSLCEFADVLGMDKIMNTLEATLDEEKDTDELLSEIAKEVNDEAYELNYERSEFM